MNNIIIRGPLGCGKSTISKVLAKKIKAKYISVDKILEENNLDNDWEEGYISQKSFLEANKIIEKIAKESFTKNKLVIIDGNFYWRSQILDLEKRLGKVTVFTLKAPLETCIQRDSFRKEKHGEKAAREVYKKVREFDFGEIIDITKPVEECTKDMLDKIFT